MVGHQGKGTAYDFSFTSKALPGTVIQRRQEKDNAKDNVKSAAVEHFLTQTSLTPQR